MRDRRNRVATVFGGTGFLGRRIARKFTDDGWTVRVAVRHPARVNGDDRVEGIEADLHDDASVAAATEGAHSVVNAVSLYVEKGGDEPTFRSVHEEGAARVARHAARNGASHMIHISGVGADSRSTSRFIAARGRGEERVRAEFADATIVRPSVMFSNDDGLLNSLAKIMIRSPVFPLIGGSTRLQPVAADDVANAVLRMAGRHDVPGTTYELGGQETATMRQIVEWLRQTLAIRCAILPIPLPFALLIARFAEMLSDPPLTVAQVQLLRHDNIVSADAQGFDRLCIQSASFREGVPAFFCSG